MESFATIVSAFLLLCVFFSFSLFFLSFSIRVSLCIVCSSCNHCVVSLRERLSRFYSCISEEATPPKPTLTKYILCGSRFFSTKMPINTSRHSAAVLCPGAGCGLITSSDIFLQRLPASLGLYVLGACGGMRGACCFKNWNHAQGALSILPRWGLSLVLREKCSPQEILRHYCFCVLFLFCRLSVVCVITIVCGDMPSKRVAEGQAG